MKRIFITAVLLVVSCLVLSDAMAQSAGSRFPGSDNTYVVTYDLKGLECVQGVGTPTQCAVTNQAADEGGYPWTKVKCRPGDKTVDRFAWSLDTNEPMGIFEAPPALMSQAKLYKVNVRLGRTCMKTGKAAR